MDSKKIKFIFALLSLCIHNVIPHSWIACTDYLENNGGNWDAAKCRTYPRDGHQYTPKGSFGLDKGYNIINPPDNNPCRTQRNDGNAYTSQYPMAVYYQGQKVVIAHPTKNHVADVRCTNKYIPDNGNMIWRSAVNAQSDPPLSQFKQNIVADLGKAPTGHQISDATTKTYPKPGFQNAPNFCSNTDKALATNMFVLPQNLQVGRYTFMWGWYFNSMQDLYTTCWEVDVVATKADRDNKYQQMGLSTAEPANVDSGSMPTAAPTMTTEPTQPTNPGGSSSTTSRSGGGTNPTGSTTHLPCNCELCQQRSTNSALTNYFSLSMLVVALFLSLFL